jgi:hypothetical protein
MLVDSPANAAREPIRHLSTLHRTELDINPRTGVQAKAADRLLASAQAMEPHENASESASQTSINPVGASNLNADGLLTIPLSVTELSQVNTSSEAPSADHFSSTDATNTSTDATVDQPVDQLINESLDNQAVEQPQSPAPDQPEADRAASDSSDPASQTLEQVTSVQQLSDVQPTDWAYQALQSLVERYGCIAGYPDGTYKGNRPLTRFEFAAGLNACLDRISELIASSTADLASKEDLATLQRLQEEFAAELAQVRGRIDSLDARVTELEANQFSTTTKLNGNAIFALADVFGHDGGRNQAVAQYRLNLSLTTSFTGRDLLLVSMYSGNVPVGSLSSDDPYLGNFDLAGTSVDALAAGAPITIKQSTAEGTLSSQFGANTNNTLQALALAYSFPVGSRLNVAIANSLIPFQLYAPALNPYLNDLDSGTGAISIFGEYNPIYTQVGGGTGIMLNYDIFDSLKLTAGYLADGLLVANPETKAGLFNGGYGVLGQLTWRVTSNFAVAAVYTNSYSPPGRFGFNYNAFGVTGTAVANSLAGQDVFRRLDVENLNPAPVVSNGYGVQFNWQPSRKFSISGWFSTFYPRLIGRGDGNILTYALTFAFPDLGKDGNLLGLVVGAEPYLTEFDGGNPQSFKVDVPVHLEAFYRWRFNDNISVTPGLIWLLAPNQDNNNSSDVIATLRTTFSF